MVIWGVPKFEIRKKVLSKDPFRKYAQDLKTVLVFEIDWNYKLFKLTLVWVRFMKSTHFTAGCPFFSMWNLWHQKFVLKLPEDKIKLSISFETRFCPKFSNFATLRGVTNRNLCYSLTLGKNGFVKSDCIFSWNS